MTARLVLTHALGMLRDRGLTVACTTSDDWISDNPTDRARAAQACAGCLVLTLCNDAAEELQERFGVWAGIDRSPTTRGPGLPRGAGSSRGPAATKTPQQSWQAHTRSGSRDTVPAT